MVGVGGGCQSKRWKVEMGVNRVSGDGGFG